MTQIGQQNHYDIKYLRGYGSQVSVKNQRIVLKNGIDVFSEKQEIEEYVPTGITICLVSIVPEATWGNIGVNKKKLSSLTRLI